VGVVFYGGETVAEKLPVIDRFMAKVQKTDTCWIWTGATNGGNDKNFVYGYFGVYPKMYYAHRFIWEYHNGPIPPKMCVMHTCDNPLCVRLDHLRLGTQLENIQDRDRKGRNGNVGRVCTDEQRQKMREAQKRRWQRPITQEERERRSEGAKAWWRERRAASSPIVGD